MSGEIYRYFKKHVPQLKVHITSWNDRTIEGIEKGDILIGVNAPITESVPFLVEQELTKLTAKVLVRRDHPITNQLITAENLAPYPLAMATSQ